MTTKTKAMLSRTESRGPDPGEAAITSGIAVPLSLRWKLIALIMVLMASLVAVLTYTQITAQKEMFSAELNKRIALQEKNLVERGKSYAANLAHQIANEIAKLEFEDANQVVRSGVAADREIKYAILMDVSGSVILHTLKSDTSTIRLTSRGKRILNIKEPVSYSFSEGRDDVVEVAAPIRIDTEPWGFLRLIYTKEYLQNEIALSRRQINEETRSMIFKSVMASLIFIFDSFIIVFIMATRFSRPIMDLTRVARDLSAGKFSASPEILIQSKDEVGTLAAAFLEMHQNLKDSYQKLEEYSKTLEQKVAERTEELEHTLEKMKEANKKIMGSIRYAQMIQSTLLPNTWEVKEFLPHSFFIWMPRDIVGGDIFYVEPFESGFIIGVFDCTGHGVPGAFMSMIAFSSLKRIITDEGCRNPGEILSRLNYGVKTLLKQDQPNAPSDEGLDAGICFVEPAKDRLTFAGARIPLLHVQDGSLTMIRGDRQSIGYKRSELDCEFQNHVIPLTAGARFYLYSDGFIDQLGGGEKERRFGTRQLKSLLAKLYHLSFENQQQYLLEAFERHKGDHERQDDVTLIGFMVK